MKHTAIITANTKLPKGWTYKDGKATKSNLTNPRSQGCPRFQSGEELANSVGKINAYYSL